MTVRTVSFGGDFAGRCITSGRVPGVCWPGGGAFRIALFLASGNSAESPQKIRLSSDVTNPLSRSRNWRADGDG